MHGMVIVSFGRYLLATCLCGWMGREPHKSDPVAAADDWMVHARKIKNDMRSR